MSYPVPVTGLVVFIVKMVYCVCSLELHHVKENRKDIPIMPPDLALRLKLISSNYPCLEHIVMTLKLFEPLKFYCI